MKVKRFADVDRRRCAACGACIRECPKELISVWKGCYAVIKTESCLGCGRCAKVCPAGSIEMKNREGRDE